MTRDEQMEAALREQTWKAAKEAMANYGMILGWYSTDELKAYTKLMGDFIKAVEELSK